jgi:hypothetical protein
MTNPYRALIQRLADELQEYINYAPTGPCDQEQELVDEARAALTEPKPPSLKEQALAALDDAVMRGDCITISDALPTIRRALEQLPND